MDEARTRLQHRNGFEVGLCARGAAIERIRVPLPGGAIDAVLAYSDTALRERDTCFLGVICGRYANRIAGARFPIGAQVFELAANPGHGGHTLHGGPDGFARRLWTQRVTASPDEVSFVLHSPDGDQGFPGALEATVTYRLLDGWALAIDLQAQSTATTVVNLANHAYFNLSAGDVSTDDHQIWIAADRFLPVRDDMIPTGVEANVAGTPFDLRRPARLGERLRDVHPQLTLAGGYDHNFILRGAPGTLRPAAGLLAPDTGLRLTVHTTQPGLQLYGGQHLTEPFQPRQGICLEAQQFPDAPNQPHFPSTLLRPGERWSQRTVYHFDQAT